MLTEEYGRHAQLTVGKPWATITGTDLKHIIRRVKPTEMLSWESLFIHVAVDHAPEHGVICGNEPAGEKRGEGKTAAGWQPPRASGCEAATSSWGSRLGGAEAPL
jgi:hypothetical protein